MALSRSRKPAILLHNVVDLQALFAMVQCYAAFTLSGFDD